MYGETTDSVDVTFEVGQGDVWRRFRALSQDPRYGHYVRIPERICRCLDHFKISSSREAIAGRLHSYYLFIGVVDDVIDSGESGVGREILEQLGSRNLIFDEETKASDVGLVTEIFKGHISPETYPAVLAKLEELYRAVMSERQSVTMEAYIKERNKVGRLTADVSYLLIRPLLTSQPKGLRRFLQKVGEVGCLIDSLIDLRADVKLGLTNFSPSVKDYVQLAGHLLRDGLGILLRHVRLSGLFVEAMIDNLLDCQFRPGRLNKSCGVTAAAIVGCNAFVRTIKEISNGRRFGSSTVKE